MGIFKRLRAPSHSNDPPATPSSTSRPITPAPELSPGLVTSPTTPPPKTADHQKRPSVAKYRFGSGAPSLSSRPQLSPSGQSSSSVASKSKLSLKPWRRGRLSMSRDEDVVAGPAYDEKVASSDFGPAMEAQSPGPSSAAGGPSHNRDSMVFIGSSSPLASHDISTEHGPTLGSPDDKSPGKRRPLSDDFYREGGVLGRLNFETSDPPVDLNGKAANFKLEKDKDNPHKMSGPWTSDVPRVDDTLAADTLTRSPERTSLVLIDPSEGQEPRSSEEVEVLESVEKKSKFWKGKGRLRRLSLAKRHEDVHEDVAVQDESPSATKVPLPPSELASPDPMTELHHPRPRALSRPSSSFFSNTFVRSLSRASLAHDLEVPSTTADDGSFQLKSFRHVSGTSDVEGAGELGRYFSHVSTTTNQPSDPVSSPNALEFATTSSRPPSNPRSNPPSAFLNHTTSPHALPRPRIATASASRPPSVAGSTISLDELMSSSPKITAAAFRKGIRRASENVRPRESLIIPDDKDEDDMPLAMRPKPKNRAMSVSSSLAAPPIVAPTTEDAREEMASTSEASLHEGLIPVRKSPERDNVSLSAVGIRQITPSPRPSTTNEPPRPPSVSPEPHRTGFVKLSGTKEPAAVHKGFVLKSSTTTWTERHHRQEPERSASRPAFESPVSTKPSTPRPPSEDAEPEILLSPLDIKHIELTMTPPLISPDDKRPLQRSVQISSSTPRSTTPPTTTAPVNSTANPATEDPSENKEKKGAPPPPVAPLELPQPGDTTPSSMDLPLPPDLMPETPPPLTSFPWRPSSRTQAERGNESRRGSLGVFDEPFRVISGFWAGISPDQTAEPPQEKDTREVLQETPRANGGGVPTKQSLGTQPESPTPRRKKAPGDDAMIRASKSSTIPAIDGSAAGMAPGAKATSNNNDDELEAWVVRSTHLLSDASDDGGTENRAPSRMTLFDASTSTDSLGRLGSRKPSDPALSRTNRSVSGLSDIDTNTGRRQAASAPRSNAGPRKASQSSLVRSGMTSGKQTRSRTKSATWSSSESEPDDQESDSPSETSPRRSSKRVSRSPRRVPRGPRDLPTGPSSPVKSTTRRSPIRDRASSAAPNKGRGAGSRQKLRSFESSSDESGSDSGDESLSVVRQRVSSSRMSEYKSSPSGRSLVLPSSSDRSRSVSGPRHAQGHNRNGSTVSTANISFGGASVASTSMGSNPQGQYQYGSGNFDQSRSTRPAFYRSATSPESSQSGRTSESLQHLVTPRADRSDFPNQAHLAPHLGPRRPEGDMHVRHGSNSSSQWMGAGDIPNMAHFPFPSPGFPPGASRDTDPNILRAQMKQAWQAQFMAAAYGASEEEWERASSVGPSGPHDHSNGGTASPPPQMTFNRPGTMSPPPSFPNMSIPPPLAPFPLPPQYQHGQYMPYGYHMPYSQAQLPYQYPFQFPPSDGPPFVPPSAEGPPMSPIPPHMVPIPPSPSTSMTFAFPPHAQMPAHVQGNGTPSPWSPPNPMPSQYTGGSGSLGRASGLEYNHPFARGNMTMRKSVSVQGYGPAAGTATGEFGGLADTSGNPRRTTGRPSTSSGQTSR